MRRARRLAVDWLLPGAAGAVLWFAVSGRFGADVQPVARVVWALVSVVAAIALVRGVVLVGREVRRGWNEAGRQTRHA